MIRWSPSATMLTAALGAVLVATPVGAQSSFSTRESPFAAISRTILGTQQRDSLVTLAQSQVGLRYRWGAKQPGKAFDCSGLVQWVMAKFAIVVPRTSREQAKQGVAVPKDPDHLLPGDLLYFGPGKRVDHVGIYLGGGKFIHAANRRKGVIVSNLPTGEAARTWWKGARRLFTSFDQLDLEPSLRLSAIMQVTES
jgi:cell wall-associated NlpC family hydrolase